MSIAECGCYFDPIAEQIVFCPVHAAAPKLLAACEAAEDLLGPVPILGDYLNRGCVVLAEIQRAIAAAKGQD